MKKVFGLILPGLLLSAALAAAAPEADPTYAALRAARPQGTAAAVTNLVIKRDAFELQFASGAFQPLSVEGRVLGAVFAGQGTLKLTPAIDAERRHLALVTADASLQTLSEPFESAVVLFTDGTWKEIESASSSAEPPARAAAIFDDFLVKQRKTLKTNLQLRLLRDVLGKTDPAHGVFLAFLPAKTYPAFLAAVDPGGLEWMVAGVGAETTGLLTVESEGSLWYCAQARDAGNDRTGGGNPSPAARRSDSAFGAENYAIETRILSNSEIRGTATIRLAARAAQARVLPLHLLGKLRVREAAFAAAEDGPWTAMPFIQEAEKEDSDAAVVFPAAPEPGKPVWLKVSYEGKDVLHAAGDGNFFVEARESWYPNLAVFSELSTYDLTFRCPKAYDVVAVGKPVESRVEADQRISRWKADRPIRVAGFNYGKFRKLERADKDSGVKIEVFTNPGTPDIINEINSLLRANSGQTGAGISDGPGSAISHEVAMPGLNSIHVDTESLADSALADGVNTARVGSAFFGPLQEQRVAITQQAQWSFGQSWPSLVFLPYMAALDGTTRREIGLKDAADFVELVGPHEVAHQWWGHLVGFQNYRDQWLSEGFAEFTASLVLERAGGMRRFHDFWEKSRKFITGKLPKSALANDQAGPITQGWRLETKRSPWAYQAMVYGKGAYVLHMLRVLMRDPGAGAAADANFIAMMKDFTTSYAGKNPTTRDFQTVVERHMTPSMNGGGDGKMDWFFKQWVYGTEIPRYKEKLDISKTPDGQYRITGSITQEGVSADFRMLSHLYLEYDKGEMVHMGVLPMIGNSTRPVDVTVKLPKAPKKVRLNAFHDVLYRD